MAPYFFVVEPRNSKTIPDKYIPVSIIEVFSRSDLLGIRNKTDLDELRDKAADRTEWQCLVEKLGETTGEVDDSDESTTEAED